MNNKIIITLTFFLTFFWIAGLRADPLSVREIRLKNQNNIVSAVNILKEAKGVTWGEVRNNRINWAEKHLKELRLFTAKNKNYLKVAYQNLNFAKRNAKNKVLSARYIQNAIVQLQKIHFPRDSRVKYVYKCDEHFKQNDVRQMKYAKGYLQKALKFNSASAIRKQLRMARSRIYRYRGKVCNHVLTTVAQIDKSRPYLNKRSGYDKAKEYIQKAIGSLDQSITHMKKRMR